MNLNGSQKEKIKKEDKKVNIKSKQNKIEIIIDWELFKRFGFDHVNRPEKLTLKIKIFWDFDILTQPLLSKREKRIIIMKKKIDRAIDGR